MKNNIPKTDPDQKLSGGSHASELIPRGREFDFENSTIYREKCFLSENQIKDVCRFAELHEMRKSKSLSFPLVQSEYFKLYHKLSPLFPFN